MAFFWKNRMVLQWDLLGAWDYSESLREIAIKKLPLTAIIIAALLVSTMFGMQVVEVAEANFTPTHPSYDPPTISILSPLNTTYEANVLLHFNISVRYPSSRNIYYTSYLLDNHEHIVFNNSTHGIDNINWSTTETLTEGTHTIQVSVSIEVLICHLTAQQYKKVHSQASQT